MRSLEGTVALVTGAARGLGAAIGEVFTSEGAGVVLTDVLDEPGREVAERLGSAATYAHLDVTREQDWERVVGEALGSFGRVDVLVNNAAILKLAPLHRFSLEDYLEVVMVNQVGCFLGMRAVFPAMRERGGAIVNISSTDGLNGLHGAIAYGASKWAVRGMSKTAAMELGKYGIRVNSLHPGGFKTEMSSPEGLQKQGVTFRPRHEAEASWPLRRSGELEEIARAVLFLASGDSTYCTGSELAVDGGQTAGPHYVVPDDGERAE